ncbi:MAG: class I SAM-dependent methyltransferase [Patescibacteria group bacterium]
MTEIPRQVPYKGTTPPNPSEYWERSALGYLRHVEGETGGDGMLIREEVLHPLMLEHLGDVRERLVFDASCGEGILSRELMKQGAKVVGGDIVFQFLKAARAAEPSTTAAVLDTTKTFPFPEATFDAVFSNLAFMWLPDIETPTRESYQILKPGGKLVVSITHPLINLGKFDLSEPEAPKLILQAPLQEGIWLKMINETNGPYPYYQRSPGTYVNTFTRAGFRVSPSRGYHDVFFSEAFLQKHPGYLQHKWYPLFLIFELIK